ncbi:unnamed protein product [Pleuronectes platessa]|uniref:Uncharacterized protein n=1 Tax=Pleuronectes platessa TaxID=8262 RepID=A0A9N7Z5A1_PLEPL|nr:unnamed protein product [Pleuronectes platessa]
MPLRYHEFLVMNTRGGVVNRRWTGAVDGRVGITEHVAEVIPLDGGRIPAGVHRAPTSWFHGGITHAAVIGVYLKRSMLPSLDMNSSRLLEKPWSTFCVHEVVDEVVDLCTSRV